MGKIRINMLSQATSVDGQGVGSAYLEQVALVKSADDLFEVEVNSKKKNFDIYHHHTVNPTYYLAYRKKGVHVTYVHFLPDTLDGSIKLPKFVFKIFKWYVTKYYRKADEIVVVNPIFIEPLTKFGIEKEKITYIPNFVSKKDFHPLAADTVKEIKDKYQIPQNTFVVLGVGQVQTRKGVLDFIEVAKKNPSMFFVWAGGFSFGKITDGYAELKKVVDNPPSNVKFLGIVKRTEMNEIYNICDVLFMPSYNELFPMSILEAVNCEKPCLLRDLDLYRDILFEKYAKASDNDTFAELLLKMKDDANYYQELVDYSKIISDFYSKEHVLELWKKYYQDILVLHKDKYKKDKK